MKDNKDQQTQAETQSYLDKVESATTTQIAQSVIAKIILKIKKLQVD